LHKINQTPRIRCLCKPWPLGLLLAAILFALLFSVFSPQYVTNDDAIILRAFMGYEGSEPATFHLYTHTVFAWFLCALAKLFPGVAWFSILQLSLLYLSSAVIIKSFAQILDRGRQSLRRRLTGALAGLFFLAAFAMFNIVRITFTFTAAFCGAAAVTHLFSIDFESGRGVIPRILGAAALLLCNYFFRDVSVLPSLCFFALAVCIKLLAGSRTRRAIRPVLTGMLCTILLFGLFVGVRATDVRLSNTREYMDWQHARISVMDYTDFEHTVTPETLRKIGWSESMHQLTAAWFFLDDRITADAFRTIKAQVEQTTRRTAAQHFTSAYDSNVAFLHRHGKISFAVLGSLLTAAAGIAAAKRRKRIWAAVGTACAVLGGAAILMYFGWLGRLNERGVMTTILPMGAYLTASAFLFSDRLNTLKPRKILTAAVVVLLAGAIAAGGTAAVLSLQYAEQKDHAYWGEYIPEVDIDEYALLCPEYLFIHDYSMPSNEIVFPNVEFGIPSNVISWGGWAIHSPSWDRTMANFGITELNASIFLRDDVIFASRANTPPQALIDYIAEYTGSPVYWEFFDTYGAVFFFTFHTD
jgi:hypothetical protein